MTERAGQQWTRHLVRREERTRTTWAFRLALVALVVGTTWLTSGLWAPAVARYYSAVSQLDDAVGIILGALAASGEDENTVVIYTSDHGDMCGSHGMLDKHYVLYDDNTRVPLIIRAPGFRSRRDESFVSNCLDIAPTVCDLAGLAHTKEHGASLLPLMRGESPEGWRTAVTSGVNGQQFGLFVNRMLRTKDYKYIWNPTDTDELYSLRSDPGELVNLINRPEHKELIASMRRALYDELKRQDDRLTCTGWLDRQLLEGKKL
jgi:arylsulfatase A-like enzyme